MRVPYTATLQTGEHEWLTFREPQLVLQADTPGAVRRTLADVEQLTRDRGLHAVGFLAYEAGAAFGLPIAGEPVDVPFAWFALFDPTSVTVAGRPMATGEYTLGALLPSRSRDEFEQAFSRIKAHIASGDTYQVNYTFRLHAPFSGDPAALFADLVAAQRGSYSAYLDLGDVAVCSASPELFFEIDGAEVRARPMKGTAKRGMTFAEDEQAGRALAASAKNRSENVMIVDMVRNDLGRVADVGTVEVSDLCAVARFPNVWQMTSSVRARSLAPLDALLAALHPSASVTGAPKVRTMALIAELEREPRGIYTGAIGHIPPNGHARFNVAIRTAVVDRRAGALSFGVGSGIVWESDAHSEYEECLVKGAVLGRRPVAFELLETLRWEPGSGYWLLDGHLSRLRDSAQYFGVPCRIDEARRALDAAIAGAQVPQRARLLVAADGTIRTEVRAHEPWAEPVRLVLAPEPIDASDVFLYHKTTNRAVYAHARALAPGADDVVLWNARGEITEATMANIVVEREGQRVTPPIRCGLLAGTCRADLLARGEVVEGIVSVEDLRTASRMWIANAVQGLREAVLVGP